MKLRYYQQEGIELIRAAFACARRVLFVMPTGSGKTASFSYVSKGASDKGKRILILAHRDELLRQISKSLRAWEVPHAILRGGGTFTPRNPVIVGGVMTVAKRLDRMIPPDLIVIDECFVAGTVVSGKNIEDIKVGDDIACFDEAGNIVNSKAISIMRRPAPDELYRIIFSNGNSVTCTGNHPFFTPNGWCIASRLESGRVVHCITDGETNDRVKVQDLRGYVCRKLGSGCEQQVWEGRDLRAGVSEKVKLYDCSLDQQNPRISPHEEKQSHVQGRDTGETKVNAKGHGPQAPSSGWKRSRPNGARAATICGTGVADKRGGCYSHGEVSRIPNMLQAGYWKRKIEDWRRGGRGKPSEPRAASSGQKENSILGVTRVESIEVYERSSGERFAQVCPDGFVYNVGVDEHHTYFSNTLAVHNCHHARSGNTYGKILAAFPNARVLMVTATPERLDGAGMGEVAEKLIVGPDTEVLTSDGWLAKARVFAPRIIPDLSKIKKRGGEYATDELEFEMNKRAITGDAISHWRKHADGKATVCFCVSVQHSKDVAAQFVENGIPAKSIDGSMSDYLKESIMRELRDGDIQVLTSCDLISEGVDVPRLEAAILLRPTMSLAVYLQQVGRTLRVVYADGYDLETKDGRLAAIANGTKPHAIILDHAGNCYKHGLPAEKRQWTLAGKKKGERKGKAEPPPLRTCPECYAIHKPTPTCEVCGHVYEVKERKIKQEDGTLEEVKGKSVKAWRWERVREQTHAETLEQLIALGESRGYSKPTKWAHIILESRRRKKNAQSQISSVHS